MFPPGDLAIFVDLRAFSEKAKSMYIIDIRQGDKHGTDKDLLVGAVASRAAPERLSLPRRGSPHSTPRQRGDPRAHSPRLGLARLRREQARCRLCSRRRRAAQAAEAAGDREAIPMMRCLLDVNVVFRPYDATSELVLCRWAHSR